MNTGVIDRFTDVFSRYIDSGFGLLGGEVAFLASTLIVIDVTLAGLFWAFGAEDDVLVRLIKKTLFVGFFAFLIGNFNGLAKVVFNSFAGLGLKAAGSGLAADQLLQPGRIAQVGVAAGKPVLQAASQLLGFTSFFENFIQIAVLMIAWFVVLVSFFIVAIQLFVTLIEFKLTTLAGFVLIPFGLFNETAFTSGSSGAGGSGGSSSSSGISSGAGGHSGASERGSQGSSGREAQGSEGGKQTTGQSSQSGSSSQRSKEREAQGSEQGKKSGQSRSS